MPSPPLAPLYTQPSLDMELQVFHRGLPPGRATLRTLRSFSANVEAGLDDRLRTLEAAQDTEAKTRASADNELAQSASGMVSNEAQARKDGDTALGQRITNEMSARTAADTAEAKTRADADTAEAQARTTADANLQSLITQEISVRNAADSAEAKTRGDADTAEATARTNADTNLQSQITAEITARAKGDTDEAKARADADAALQTQITALKAVVVPLTGSMILPAGISILAGKSTRTVAVTGMKRNDNLVVTPNAALPANISMGEAFCLADGTLTVVLVNSAALGLSIATQQTIPLGIIALRP